MKAFAITTEHLTHQHFAQSVLFQTFPHLNNQHEIFFQDATNVNIDKEKNLMHLDYLHGKYKDSSENYNNKESKNTDNKPNTAGQLMDDMIRDANNITELTAFNGYADDIKNRLNIFWFWVERCINASLSPDAKLFLEELKVNPNSKLVDITEFKTPIILLTAFSDNSNSFSFDSPV